MPQHIGMIQPQFVVALSEMEVDIIVTALLEAGHVELAEDFEDAAYGGCECEDCSEPEGGWERLEAIHARRANGGSRPSGDFLNNL